MKKILIWSNVLLIGVITFQACNNNRNAQGYSSIPTTNSCTTIACKSYLHRPLPGLVDGDLVKKMSLAYSRDTGKAYIKGYNRVAENSLQGDALSVCFNIEQIKNLIWKMEQEACIEGCNTKELKLGIRFYYVKYPDQIDAAMPADFREILNEHKGKHSLVMVPAFWHKNKNNYYDFILNGIKDSCFLKPISQLGGNSKIVWALIPSDGEGDNHGGIAPPPKFGTYPTNPGTE